MSRPLPHAHPPEDYIPTLEKLLSNPPVPPEVSSTDLNFLTYLKSHYLTADFTEVTVLTDPINGFPPGYDRWTWDIGSTKKMTPCYAWYGSVAHPWDEHYGKYLYGAPQPRYPELAPYPLTVEKMLQSLPSTEKLRPQDRTHGYPDSQTRFSNWVRTHFELMGRKWETNYDEKYFVLFVVWKPLPEHSIMLLHDRITALEKNNSKELLVQLETTDELTKFLVQAKVQTHEEGLRREGFCEVDDLVDAEDKDLVDAGLKITEIRRIRRYLSKPKLDPFGDVFGDVPVAVAAAAAAEDTSLSAQEQEMKENK